MLRSATLLEFFERAYLSQRRLRPTSIYTVRRHLAIFIAWAGQDPLLPQVDQADVVEFLNQQLDHYAPWTVRGIRGSLLGVLALAADMGLCQPPDRRRIRPIKKPALIPSAWTADEVRWLLAACQGMKYGDWLERMVRASWDTGLRAEDLYSLDMAEFRPDGRGAIRQSKTTDPVLVTLSEATMVCLRAAGSRHPLRRPMGKSTSYYWWKKLCRAAGVPYGASQRMRRSAATNVHCRRPDDATAFLGHRDPTLALKHYIDPRIAAVNQPRPEEL